MEEEWVGEGVQPSSLPIQLPLGTPATKMS